MISIGLSVGMLVSCAPGELLAEDMVVSEDEVIVVDNGGEVSTESSEEIPEPQVPESQNIFEDVESTTTGELTDAMPALSTETEGETEAGVESEAVSVSETEAESEIASDIGGDEQCSA